MDETVVYPGADIISVWTGTLMCVSTTRAFHSTPVGTTTRVSCQSSWQLRGTIDNQSGQTSNADTLKSQLQSHADRNPARKQLPPSHTHTRDTSTASLVEMHD